MAARSGARSPRLLVTFLKHSAAHVSEKLLRALLRYNFAAAAKDNSGLSAVADPVHLCDVIKVDKARIIFAAGGGAFDPMIHFFLPLADERII
jgi:hypothetical protein